jgi:hypothetical protein
MDVLNGYYDNSWFNADGVVIPNCPIGQKYDAVAGGCVPSSYLPTISAGSPSLINTTAANMGITVLSLGGYETSITFGVCWSTSPTPTTSDNVIYSVGGRGSSTFTIEDLLHNTTYYVRAYATNSTGTVYGVTFTIVTPIDVPKIFSYPAYSVTSSTANVNTFVQNLGGDSSVTYGICWSEKQIPTIYDYKTSDITTKATASIILIQGLNFNTMYYYRSYAINSVGIYYDQEHSFITNDHASCLSSEDE